MKPPGRGVGWRAAGEVAGKEGTAAPGCAAVAPGRGGAPPRPSSCRGWEERPAGRGRPRPGGDTAALGGGALPPPSLSVGLSAILYPSWKRQAGERGGGGPSPPRHSRGVAAGTRVRVSVEQEKKKSIKKINLKKA